MPRYIAALTIVLLLGMVLTRVLLMKRKGIEAMNFGKIDREEDYLKKHYGKEYWEYCSRVRRYF